MRQQLLELYGYRGLLYMIVWRDIKVRYKQSVMGVLWAVLMPMFIVSAGIMVKYVFAMISHEPLSIDDIVVVSVKSIPWAFLVASIRFSCQSLLGNPNLVAKVYFPKEIFPVAAVASQLFDFAVASAVLTVLLAFARTGFSLHLLWMPALLAMLILLAIGIGLLVSAGSLFFRDVKYLVEVFLTFAIFFTPVFYDVTMFGQRAYLLLLNPAAPILEGFSSIIRHQNPNFAWLTYSFVFTASTVLLSYVVFKKAEPSFAESI
ncbi:MAG: ABC transporter permease [Acidobacteria bacterium]|nr:ABC transporter permease [Acidobacteriota bacterium]